MTCNEENGLRAQCTVNIEGGDECVYNDMKKDGDGRTVVVIGAGPAGLEAARVLAERKFKVVLFEKKGMIGGQLNYANKPPKKDKINWIMEYYESQIAKLGIDLRLNTEATAENVKALDPYAVFFAAGSSPVMPRSIPGIQGKNVFTPPQVLTGEVKFSNENICVVGSGMTGIETAELLAEQGNHIKLYEMADDIGPGLFFQNLIDVMGRLAPTGCEFYPKSQLVELGDNCAKFKSTVDGSESTCEYDHVIVSLGTRSNPVPEDLKEAFPDMIALGDAERAGRIRHAMETAYKAAYNLK